MACLKRIAFFACAVLLAAALYAAPASSEQIQNASPVTLAMAPAPLSGDALPPPLVQPVLLCGRVWVNTTYVLANNCQRACLNRHTRGECLNLVPICRQCWASLQFCAASTTIPPALRCRVCTDRYAACMRPFF